MCTSPSNLADAFDASAHPNPPGEPGGDGTCVRAETVGAAQCNLLSAADDIGKEHVRPTANLPVITGQGDKLAKLETNVRSPQGAPEGRRLPRRVRLQAVPGLPSVDGSARVPNSSSLEPDTWGPTPALRQPSDRLSNRTKFLIAGAIAVPLAGYFIFGSANHVLDVVIAPRPQSISQPLEFCHCAKLRTPAATASINVESQLRPDVETASSQPPARSDRQPTENGIEAKPPQTLSERGQQLLLAESSHDATCFPSASAALLNYPGARPSWTLRATWS
jgi:hypothetical protein